MDKAEKMVEAIRARLGQYAAGTTAEIQGIAEKAVAEVERRVEEVTAALAIMEPELLKSLIDKGGTVRQIMVSTESEAHRLSGQRGVLSYTAAPESPEEVGSVYTYSYRRDLEIPEVHDRKRVRLTIIAEPIEEDG